MANIICGAASGNYNFARRKVPFIVLLKSIGNHCFSRSLVAIIAMASSGNHCIVMASRGNCCVAMPSSGNRYSARRKVAIITSPGVKIMRLPDFEVWN